MSHFSRITTEMSDEKILFKALDDLGYSYQVGDQHVTGFGGQKTSVSIRVSMPKGYDIGLRNKGNYFEIIADWFGVRGTNQKQFTNQLKQRYAYCATRIKLEEQGFDMIEEKVEETGQIRIVLRRIAQ